MPLSELIRQTKEEILLEWEEIVRSLGSSRHLSRPVLINHMPDFLDWLVLRLEREPSDEEQFPQDQALEHALGRIRAGYDLSELLSEYMVLRDCLHEAWERQERRPVTPREIRRMNQALDDAITFTAVFYARCQLRREDEAHPVSSSPVH